MNRRKAKRKFTLWEWLVVALGVILLINMFSLGSKLMNMRSTYPYDYSDLSRNFQEGRYLDLIDEVVYNRTMDYESKYDLEPYYLFADFYEAQTLYYAYAKEGNEELADFYKEKCDSIYQQLEGEFKTAADEVINKYQP